MRDPAKTHAVATSVIAGLRNAAVKAQRSGDVTIASDIRENIALLEWVVKDIQQQITAQECAKAGGR
ncbi:hypothetical protein [Xanthobacter agilis]|uniref:Uncharacterized protein n=1 Tax=Xanthobacter agilis TaxID=47492 RepID=A0ABU0LFP1_XANAG|nr:hypothetical protein [Xanthobacter agilis]MDQ0505961.1 hypothetical protein [Xanthobacter agilis]